MKPGYKTSELLVAVAAGIATVLSKHLHITVTSTMVLDGLAAVYVAGRTWLKKNYSGATSDVTQIVSRLERLESGVAAISSIIPIPPTK